MLKKLLNYLKSKKILILGFGKEGEATYMFLRKSFPEQRLYIADKNMNLLQDKAYLLEDEYVEVSLGEDYFRDIDYYDLVIKTPGISLKDYNIEKFKNKITSELELLFEFVPCLTIGITGTKGKSTTSTLMYTVLKNQGKDVLLLGNIGEPIFNRIDEINENTIVVLELSSHALEFVKKSPNIAILLDIYEEHLDHYKSMQHYIAAKFNVAKYQNKKDIFIYNASNEYIKNFNFNYKPNDIAVYEYNSNDIKYKNNIRIENNNIYYKDEVIAASNLEMNLKGEHNLNNVLFILAASKILNLDINNVVETIKEFKGLEHRMEFVGKINNVKYYNDSIATIPEATIFAINALKEVNTLIVGGKDRGIDLKELIEFLKNSSIENIICLPKTGEFIFEQMNSTDKKMYMVQTMPEAVNKAKEITKENTICLLSPAASSYGYFKNFEERGNIFKENVLM